MKRIPKTNIYDVTIDISNPTKFHFRFIYIYQPCPAPCIYIAQTGAIQVILSRNCSWLEGVVLSKNPVTNAFILRKFSSVDLYKQSVLPCGYGETISSLAGLGPENGSIRSAATQCRAPMCVAVQGLSGNPDISRVEVSVLS